MSEIWSNTKNGSEVNKWMSEFDKTEIGKIGIGENKNNNAHNLYFIQTIN